MTCDILWSTNLNHAGDKVIHNSLLYNTGGSVVHSYGRLIPHEFPITDLQQISGPDGIGRINCTVSSGEAKFAANGGVVESEGVTEIRNKATSTLMVNPSNVSSFQSRGLYCTNINTNFFYLFISSASKYTSFSCDTQYIRQHNTAVHAGMVVCLFVFWIIQWKSNALVCYRGTNWQIETVRRKYGVYTRQSLLFFKVNTRHIKCPKSFYTFHLLLLHFYI